ncbi:MAG TPA: hypothetical protein VKA31_02425 [Mariprofundaceae bacterium]|nr:hypothetical protein [Mariprofundaceae bacterium]
MSDTLLRPDFTQALAARLQQGASINLTASHGLGRRRTLQDLRALLPGRMRVLYADMKFCVDDCAATLADLAAQAGIPDILNLGQLIEGLAANPDPALLILHNFDLLRSQPHDPLFDSALLPYLAHVVGHAQLALLVVCEDVYPDWPLPCEHQPLPPA